MVKKITRYDLAGTKKLRIDEALAVELKMNFWNRLKFLFRLKTTAKYFETTKGIQSGWYE